MPFRRSSGPRRAVTLIEAVLFTAVALTLIVGGLVFYQQVQTARQTQEAVRLVQSLVAESRALLKRADFNGATQLDEILIASGAVPSIYVKTETGPSGSYDYIASPWLGADSYGNLAGEIWVGGGPFEDLFMVDRIESNGIDSDAIQIVLWNTPSSVCTRIATFEPDGTGPLGTNIAGVFAGDRTRWAVSERLYDEVAGHNNVDSVGLSPAEAAEWCKDIKDLGMWVLSVIYFSDG